jgi:carboxylate-amine ligase
MRITFHPSQHRSIGIEWELELVDRDSGELTSGATVILDRLGSCHGGEHPKAKHELLESCVEVITGICATVPEALADLDGTVAEVREEADKLGLELMCSGTHPMTDWATQQVSPSPRYHMLIDQMQWMARQLQIFGVHVHVGVQSGKKVVPIVNALTSYMPHLLALSASSPYWIGTDTGLASYRSKVFEGLPTAGPPYLLSGWPQFQEFIGTLISANAISSIREVWWDIRPHPDFGTVELRIFDGLPTLFEVGVSAALSQCLVEMLSNQIDRGYKLPTPRDWTIRENKWRAARHGLDADVIVDDSGETRPIRDAISDLVRELTPIAERLGCVEQLHGAHTILATGPSYIRQRAVAASSDGNLGAVVRSLVSEMSAGRPAGVGVPPGLGSVGVGEAGGSERSGQGVGAGGAGGGPGSGSSASS